MLNKNTRHRTYRKVKNDDVNSIQDYSRHLVKSKTTATNIERNESSNHSLAGISAISIVCIKEVRDALLFVLMKTACYQSSLMFRWNEPQITL